MEKFGGKWRALMAGIAIQIINHGFLRNLFNPAEPLCIPGKTNVQD